MASRFASISDEEVVEEFTEKLENEKKKKKKTLYDIKSFLFCKT